LAAASTILVVEDDTSLRLLCRVNLEAEGYRVLEAPNVDTAVALAPEADLVLLDLHVGAARGRDVFDPVRRANPDVLIVLLTGSVEVDAELRAAAADLITKPFAIEELIAAAGRAGGRQVGS
jgi:DNA-binding response OmpR family regulator